MKRGEPRKTNSIVGTHVYGENFEFPQGFIEKPKKYIHYCNIERISLRLKGMSPVKYRAHFKTI